MVYSKYKNISKNALPILAYYDIFKNYYANTQEENFYIIGNTEELTITINGKRVNPNVISSNEGRINNAGVITISPNTIKQNDYTYRDWETDRKSTRLNSSHRSLSRMPSSA